MSNFKNESKAGMLNSGTGDLLEYGDQLDKAFMHWLEIQNPALFAERFEVFLGELKKNGYKHVGDV